MTDVAIIASEVAPAPQQYTLPGAQEILLKAVGCQVNGSAASGPFLPALQMLDPAGHVMWTAVNDSLPVAVGGSVLVSWFPGGGINSAPTSTPVAATGIDSISSPLSTIGVGNPSGPATTLDLPLSGVSAATYGDATHVGQFVVNAEGVITGATSVAISGAGGAGGLIVLYDSGYIGSAQATLDTGANAIPSGHFDLQVFLYCRTDRAAVQDNVNITINADSGAHYDYERVKGGGGTASALGSAANSGLGVTVASATATSGEFSSLVMLVPSYDGTAGWKEIIALNGIPDTTTTNSIVQAFGAQWRSTAAINQLTFAPAVGLNFVTGSRLVVYAMK